MVLDYQSANRTQTSSMTQKKSQLVVSGHIVSRTLQPLLRRTKPHPQKAETTAAVSVSASMSEQTGHTGRGEGGPASPRVLHVAQQQCLLWKMTVAFLTGHSAGDHPGRWGSWKEACHSDLWFYSLDSWSLAATCKVPWVSHTDHGHSRGEEAHLLSWERGATCLRINKAKWFLRKSQWTNLSGFHGELC